MLLDTEPKHGSCNEILYIWVKERAQPVSHVVVSLRVFCSRIAECNDPTNCWDTRCVITFA